MSIGAILLIENIRPNFDAIVGRDADHVMIERGVVQSATPLAPAKTHSKSPSHHAAQTFVFTMR